ncbi:hypothetical protein CLOM_g20911 [Closterium sp. NIES-68]|nr:hypothetical protein CLOM_g20911 [Closterium sp. NIES-68]GJP72994.1 hypothetical protein CLOP_g3757 [Closterium sp. NIES-67]
MASQPHARYTRVPTSDSDAAPDFASHPQTASSAFSPSTTGRARASSDGDIRFTGPDIQRRVPKRSVLLALFLLFLGSASLVVFYLMQSGQVEAGGQQKWTCLAIAFLTLMPGFYESRIAYYSWRQAPGYSFSQIPRY